MRRLVAALACRAPGSRLYGKPLQHLDTQAGVTILDQLIRLIRTLPCIDEVVLGISAGQANLPFVELAGRHGRPHIIGDERDVLQRLIDCARAASATDVFRVTTESPFFYYELVEEAWQRHVRAGNDVTTIDGVPEGAHFEIYTLNALEQSHRRGEAKHRSEYCSLYIREHPRDFQIEILEPPSTVQRMDLRLTVDYPEDLVLCRETYTHLCELAPRIPLDEIIRFLDAHPELTQLVAPYVSPKRLWPAPGGTVSASSPAHQARTYDSSHALKARAERVIPSCTQTFSKGPSQFPQPAAPVFLVRGDGAKVWDVDGNEYIDSPMALGPMILGYGDPAVTAAVQRQLREGTTFSLPHPVEVEAAELLCEVIPCAEMVRFGKNGSDATAGAVRAARAFTNRDVIACCGYHGWQDWYIGTTTRRKGVPKAVQELTVPFAYNDLESLHRIFVRHPGRVAAVIMEPVGVIPPRPDFLQAVRSLAHEHGALLIFDEIVTGFRLALGGAQDYFGVTPDLACFGKGMANGYPVSAVVGRRQIMAVFDEIFFSFTFGGETLSLAAAIATIGVLRTQPVIAHLWEQGRRLQEGYNALSREFGLESRTACVGLPPRTAVTFTESDGSDALELKSLFQQECLSRGVLFTGSQNICYRHTPAQIDETLAVYRAAFEVVADAVESGDAAQRLRGEPVQPVFRKA